MRLHDDHAFFRVARTPFHTSEGTVDLPILYYDVTNVVALFTAPRSEVAALLDGTGLEPGFTIGGDALVALSFYEYRRTTIGPYNEVGLATFAKRRGQNGGLFPATDLFGNPDRRDVGAFVIDLPVTTGAAWAAGRELWGYPKFVAPISVHLNGRSFDGAISAPEGRASIASVAGTLGPSLPAPPLSLMLYSLLEGRMLRTNVHVRGTTRVHAPGTCRLSVGASDHPMAERLRRLVLDGAKPLLVLVTDDFQSRLHAGVLVDPRSSAFDR